MGNSGIIPKHISASNTLDFPSIAGAGGTGVLTISVPGAVVGDGVTVVPPSNLNLGLIPFGFVSSADTVTIRVVNASALPVDPPSGAWKVFVHQT